MSNSNDCQCNVNVKSRIERKPVLLRNSNVHGTVLFIIIMKLMLWQNSISVHKKTV